MVIVDASALIPLAWMGRLNLVTAIFQEPVTTDHVKAEVLVEGKPGTASLNRFFDMVTIRSAPSEAEEVAQLEGIAVADASVILLADECQAVLLANDKALIEVARSHGVDCWWVMTLLLRCTKREIVSGDEAKEILYDLVDAGMHLSPQGYVRLQKRLEVLDSSPATRSAH